MKGVEVEIGLEWAKESEQPCNGNLDLQGIVCPKGVRFVPALGQKEVMAMRNTPMQIRLSAMLKVANGRHCRGGSR